MVSTNVNHLPTNLQDKRICVYCGSTSHCQSTYLEEAFRLGEQLAIAGAIVVYGGGGSGSMGALAEGVLHRKGRIVGVIPQFMVEREWAHDRLEELRIVEDMRTRKHLMLESSSACIALPGGNGTFEELMETVTLKRLGIYTEPILVVNQHDYYAPLLHLMDHAIAQRFIPVRQDSFWKVVSGAEEAVHWLREQPLRHA